MNVVLTSLTKDNFVLKENAQLQNIATILNVVQSNVSVVVALDWSISTTNVVSEIKAGAISFINQLTDNDEAAIYKFNAAINSYPTSLFTAATTSGKASLISYINTNISRPSGTALYDVVMQAVDRAAQGTTGKQRAVIVLSDGVDTSISSSTLDQAIAQAAAKGIPVFAIYYVDPNYSGGNYGKPEVMQRLAKETGGQYYSYADADLTTIFLQIANVLSNKYTITYTSSTCSGNVTLDMRATLNDLYGQDSGMVTFP
jgi:VWFA-related protein